MGGLEAAVEELEEGLEALGKGREPAAVVGRGGDRGGDGGVGGVAGGGGDRGGGGVERGADRRLDVEEREKVGEVEGQGGGRDRGSAAGCCCRGFFKRREREGGGAGGAVSEGGRLKKQRQESSRRRRLESEWGRMEEKEEKRKSFGVPSPIFLPSSATEAHASSAPSSNRTRDMVRIASQCERQGKKLQKEPQTRTLHRRRCQEAALAAPDRCMSARQQSVRGRAGRGELASKQPAATDEVLLRVFREREGT